MVALVQDVKDEIAPWVTLGTEPGVAPGALERVRALLNTDDRFHRVDHLPGDAPAWLRGLRDALRAYVVDDRPEALDRFADGRRVALRFEASGPAIGYDDTATGMLVDVLDEHRAGRLQRLKACANPDCQWVYYDASRNRSGRWCSMGECGDVMKARAYRARSRS